MEQALDFITRHGGPVIFVYVFLDQLGLPIPTVPILLALGGLAGSGRIDPVFGLLVAVSASICADLVWYWLGRRKGTGALGLLCRVALEPDTCVSKTRDLFARHGVKSLLFAKFVPGLDTVGPPLAGMLGVRPIPFVLWSGAGGFLWLGTFGGLGYLFTDQIEGLAGAADRFGTTLALVVVGLGGAYIAWKYRARQRVLQEIRMARITPDELDQLISSGGSPVIIDARSESALEALPFVIQGAQFLPLDEVDERHSEIPREGDVVVYCSCPNDVSSARVALKLKRLGFQRVRPLAGGIEAWRAHRLPTIPAPPGRAVNVRSARS